MDVKINVTYLPIVLNDLTAKSHKKPNRHLRADNSGEKKSF